MAELTLIEENNKLKKDTGKSCYIEDAGREHFTKQIEFFLSCVGYAVALGNILRFPYLCIKNGGGAFLIPYFLFLFLCGIPLFLLEVALGQFSGKSPLQVWEICPLFKGIGYAMVIQSTVTSIQYNTVMCWILYYLVKSFTLSLLPWSTCDNKWNTRSCQNESQIGTNDYNQLNATACEGGNVSLQQDCSEEHAQWASAAEEYWQNNALELSEGIDHIGGIKWDLFGLYCLSWLILFLCIIKGVKSLGKVVYVTATAPYLFLTALLIRGLTLPGSWEGINFYIVPEWSKLLEFQVWTEALLQVFYSLGPGWGGIITMASYSKFHNNCKRDSILVPLINCLSSFYGGFVIFSVIGFMAYNAKKSVKDVVTSGPGLAFVVYPEALGKMPFSPLWAILFFLVLLSVGLDSQFGTFETMTSSIIDKYPKHLKKHQLLFRLAVCAVGLLLGIIYVTRAGLYIFLISDWYAAVTISLLALCEVCIVAWIYGYDKLCYDIKLMTGIRPGIYWKMTWCFVSPALLIVIMVYSFFTLKIPMYGNYEYPWWAILIGWTFTVVPMMSLPVCAMATLLQQKGTILQRLRVSLKPSKKWGPADPKCQEMYNYSRNGGLCPGVFKCAKYKGSDCLAQESTV